MENHTENEMAIGGVWGYVGLTCWVAVGNEGMDNNLGTLGVLRALQVLLPQESPHGLGCTIQGSEFSTWR